MPATIEGLRLMEISEILRIANRSVDFPEMDDELDWWGIFSSKVSNGHFDAVVDELQTNGFGMPIVLCDRYGDGNYWVGNGHHRLCAAILMGLWRIPVILSSGDNRDDFMRGNDSMDDYGRPIDYPGTHDYWDMLCGNMEEVAPRQYKDKWCMACGTYDYYTHEHTAPELCAVCEHQEEDCVCYTIDLEMWAAASREWRFGICGDCGVYGYVCDHGKCARDRDEFEAHVENDIINSLRNPRFIWDDEPNGAWHPEAILNDAYAQHAEWLADADLREARRQWELAVSKVRDAVRMECSDILISILSRNVRDKWDAYQEHGGS